MITQFYQNIILKNPKSILIILLIALFTFGYYSKDFKLDASSETLLIEGDPDLEYLEEIINIDTVNFYALQKEVSVADNEWLKCQTKIHNLG